MVLPGRNGAQAGQGYRLSFHPSSASASVLQRHSLEFSSDVLHAGGFPYLFAEEELMAVNVAGERTAADHDRMGDKCRAEHAVIF